MLKRTRMTKRIGYGGLLLVLSALALIGAGACKKEESRTAGKEARETFEKSKEFLKGGLEKTKDLTKDSLEKGGEVAKEGLDKSKEAAKEFSKGWKEGGSSPPRQ